MIDRDIVFVLLRELIGWLHTGTCIFLRFGFGVALCFNSLLDIFYINHSLSFTWMKLNQSVNYSLCPLESLGSTWDYN